MICAQGPLRFPGEFDPVALRTALPKLYYPEFGRCQLRRTHALCFARQMQVQTLHGLGDPDERGITTEALVAVYLGI